MIEGASAYLPVFRELYAAIQNYEGDALYQDILRPALPDARDAMQQLERYRSRNSARHPYAVAQEHRWTLYALSRANDFFLLPYPAEEGFLQGKPSLTTEEYLAFFHGLGCASFTGGTFTPFRHEVVQVAEAPAADQVATIERIFWPGLMFGDMLFSRAGVRVCCGSEVMVKAIAERSTLYFTYARPWRPAADLSHGWGSNSQWRTSFRRDYQDGTQFYYHVDGKHGLNPPTARALKGPPEDDLTREQRIELLTHRCFVRCAKPDGDRWPYDDTYVEPRCD